MEPKLYQQMMEVEDQHWWFSARRMILNEVITRLNLSKSIDILEAGCGTGGNLAMLSKHGKVYGMELDETARYYATQRRLGNLKGGRLPDEIPFGDKTFDLIVVLDVLEHLDEDLATLKALYLRLKPEGILLITVPAYAWLWSQQDILLHHKRRYLLGELSHLVKCAGYQVQFTSYFNTLLFLFIAIIRFLQRVLNKGGNETEMPSFLLNTVLRFIFACERHIIGKIPFPFGVSILLVAQKL